MSIVIEDGQIVNVVKEQITRQHIVDKLDQTQAALTEARDKVAKLEAHANEVAQDLTDFDALSANQTPAPEPVAEPASLTPEAVAAPEVPQPVEPAPQEIPVQVETQQL